MRGRRYWFPDEEPEPDSPAFDYGYAATSDVCGRCGQRGHRYEPSRAECPNFPMMIRRRN